MIAAAAIGIAASPELTVALTATRENQAQLWPHFTAHLCHWNGSHLFWNLLVFVIVGPLVERRLGRAFLPFLALAGAAIVATVFQVMPQIGSYRGLSGIDTFLYTFAAIEAGRAAYPGISRNLRGLVLVPLFLLMGKIVYEAATGEGVFTGSLGHGIVSLPLAHLTGAVAAISLWALWRIWLLSVRAPLEPRHSGRIHPASR